ncbi:MAG: hypothetical protein CSA07_01240 [Bacteroidia bacterium]|nr:MAG: hypothetical protein CSA07_01240 [Bacteroidia bacterium]
MLGFELENEKDGQQQAQAARQDTGWSSVFAYSLHLGSILLFYGSTSVRSPAGRGMPARPARTDT